MLGQYRDVFKSFQDREVKYLVMGGIARASFLRMALFSMNAIAFAPVISSIARNFNLFIGRRMRINEISSFGRNDNGQAFQILL